MSQQELKALPPKEWVAGFCFHKGEHGLVVALIRKARPEWQRGKLNGVGGKIEKGETPWQAMVREWLEETKAISPDWMRFAMLDWSGGRVHFFGATSPVRLALNEEGDEPVHWRNVEAMLKEESPVIPNLRWLIPLALDKDSVIVHAHESGTAWNAPTPSTAPAADGEGGK